MGKRKKKDEDHYFYVIEITFMDDAPPATMLTGVKDAGRLEKAMDLGEKVWIEVTSLAQDEERHFDVCIDMSKAVTLSIGREPAKLRDYFKAYDGQEGML